MRVLMVASEAVPFAKTGGLADVAGILPKFLAQLGDDVRIVMPLYGVIDRERYGLKPIPGAMGVPMGVLGEHWCEVYESTLPNTKVPVYFIAHERYFGRKSLYNEANGEGFMDNDNRFVFLSRAALQLCKKLDFSPDIVHANDWHTAAVPIFLNTVYRHDSHLGGAASLLTIHNMEYQGRYYAGLMDVLGIGWEYYNHLGLEWNDKVNLLKGGIYHSTLFNAVSPGYAEEIKTERFGHGLEGVVRDKSWALRGVLNGMDYEEWNPADDEHIAAPYDVGDMDGKAECKRALQEELGLVQRSDVPLYGLVARLVDQKGIRLLAEVFEALMGLDLQIALLGSGESWAHDFFDAMARRYPGKFGLYLGYSNPLAHRIEAGSDFFLMPSVFEPCGLNQLFSLRYGSIPIVHAVGGLNDTVENFDAYHRKGTGFKYYDQTPSALYNTIGWSLYTYYNEADQIDELRERGMKKRFSWEDSARKYRELYEEARRIRF
ncbi:MAG: glycogen synthase [Bradymonadales bacterium]